VDGGAIFNAFPDVANVYNSTIAFNGADPDPIASTAAGGVLNDASATFNLRNTLLAGNYHDSAFDPADCTGTVNVFGQNLFGTTAGCTVNPSSGNSGLLNSLFLIGPLQDNGGPTWTHALLAGSNAIDAGDPVNGCIGPDALPLATDQRGVPRIVGNSCDVGAFEYLPPAAFLPLLRQ
jgi:hypothetical protein